MSGASSAGQARTVSSVLVPRSTVSLTLAQRHDPAAFYQTRSGLYVYKDFLDRIISKAKPVPAGTAYQLAVSCLLEAATDAQIENSLPKDHLINNGYANLFYTASSVADVRWDGVYRLWFVRAWLRGGFGWGADGRVVSPA